MTRSMFFLILPWVLVALFVGLLASPYVADLSFLRSDNSASLPSSNLTEQIAIERQEDPGSMPNGSDATDNDPMALAEAAYARGDYRSVLSMLSPLAEAGDGLAQYRLGLMHVEGLGTPENTDKAIDWFSRALANGATEAQPALVSLFDTLTRNAENPEDEIKWLQRAVELNDAKAQATLGSYYLVGNGVKKDLARARMLLEVAAKRGDPRAATNLGFMYASGTGVPKDFERAHEHYLSAAEAGLPRAQTALAVLYEQGEGVEEANFQEAIRWYTRAASAGDLNANAKLGFHLARDTVQLTGADASAALAVFVSAAQGDAEAVNWLAIKTAEGNVYATARYAELLLDPQRDVFNRELGLDTLYDAAMLSDIGSQLRLARHYASGDGVEMDYVMAHVWANIAAASGYEEAKILRDNLVSLMTDEQVEQAQQEARDWLTADVPVK